MLNNVVYKYSGSALVVRVNLSLMRILPALCRAVAGCD